MEKGDKHGRLTILNPNFARNDGGYKLCRVQCECGTLKTVRVDAILQGHTKSCGCLLREHSRRIGRRNVLRNVPGLWLMDGDEE